MDYKILALNEIESSTLPWKLAAHCEVHWSFSTIVMQIIQVLSLSEHFLVLISFNYHFEMTRKVPEVPKERFPFPKKRIRSSILTLNIPK